MLTLKVDSVKRGPFSTWRYLTQVDLNSLSVCKDCKLLMNASKSKSDAISVTGGPDGADAPRQTAKLN